MPKVRTSCVCRPNERRDAAKRKHGQPPAKALLRGSGALDSPLALPPLCALSHKTVNNFPKKARRGAQLMVTCIT